MRTGLPKHTTDRVLLLCEGSMLDVDARSNDPTTNSDVVITNKMSTTDVWGIFRLDVQQLGCVVEYPSGLKVCGNSLNGFRVVVQLSSPIFFLR